MRTFVTFMKNEIGATAIEYGLVVAFVSLAGIAALQFMGTNLSNFFSSVTSTVDSGRPGA